MIDDLGWDKLPREQQALRLAERWSYISDPKRLRDIVAREVGVELPLEAIVKRQQLRAMPSRSERRTFKPTGGETRECSSDEREGVQSNVRAMAASAALAERLAAYRAGVV